MAAGFAPRVADAKTGTLIYVEVVKELSRRPGNRNFASLKRIIAVHESGHLFGMEHGDGGIMAEGGKVAVNDPKDPDPSFTPLSLRRIMLRGRPGGT